MGGAVGSGRTYGASASTAHSDSGPGRVAAVSAMTARLGPGRLRLARHGPMPPCTGKCSYGNPIDIRFSFA